MTYLGNFCSYHFTDRQYTGIRKGQMGSQYLFPLGMRCKSSGCSGPLAVQHGWEGEAATQWRFQEVNQAVLVDKLQPLFPIFLLINLCLVVNPYGGSWCRELRNLCGIQGYGRCVKMKPNLKDLAD